MPFFDGTKSWLVRHPVPPDGFLRVENCPEMRVFTGRHESIRANTSIELGGAETATLIVNPARPRQAALLIHEGFHAFLRTTHRGWAANEASLGRAGAQAKA